jgi:DNA-directed RNA polymerase specialized sigma54-like protein
MRRFLRHIILPLTRLTEIYETDTKAKPETTRHTNESTVQNVIYPDSLSGLIDGDIKIELTDDFVPSLRISRDYLEIVPI